MFPPQTSLIPVTVTLSRFAEGILNQNGWLAIRSLSEGWFPFWYLGVPYRFLTGPVVPLISFYVHKALPNVSLFSITIYFIVASFLLGALGWGRLVAIISKKRGIGIIVSILFLILPWKYLSSIALSEASAVVSRNLLPFVFLAFLNYYKKLDKKTGLLAVLALSLLLLINTTILAIFAVGISALILAFSFSKGKFRKVSKYIKLSLVLVISALFLVTFWYTPRYWIVVVLNPSIGGAAGYKVFLRIIDLLRAAVPLGLAIATVFFSGKIKRRLTVFSLVWVFTFLFLTAFRFVGDADFWQDWSSWFFELETGVALLAAMPIWTIFLSLKEKKNDYLYNRKIYLAILIILILPFLLSKYIYTVLNEPRLISNSPPSGVKSLSKLSELAGSSRTFISGSTVFWAGSTGASTALSRTSSPLYQVRGGQDKAATHSLWDHAAFQLREGENYELAEAWLKVLGVEYVLVHGPTSVEAYHDFRNIDKWDEVGKKEWEGGGDIIYKISDIGLAWEVDSSLIEKAKRPSGGDDLGALQMYLSARLKKLEVEKVKDEYKLTSDSPMENVLVLISYSSKWKARTGNGRNLKARKDNFGHLLIYARGGREIILSI